MRSDNRTQIVVGILLILLGAWFVAVRLVPQLRPWENVQFEWPFYVVAAGAVILVVGLLTGAPGMTIPASIVAGIGGILYYQNLTQRWDTWSFMWALIPGFVGFGTILAGLLGENTRHNLARGFNLMVISALLFLIFAAIFGGLPLLGPYGPAALLVLLGLYILVRGFVRSRGSGGGQNAAG